MLSIGQWIFAILFFIGFVFFVSMSYKKDRKLHRREYRGSFWVLVGFIAFVLILFGIKYYLKE